MSDWEDMTSVTMAEDILAPEPAERDRAYLVVLAGANVGEMFKLNQAQVVLGRGKSADIRVIDDGVSREHARIRAEGAHVYVEDLGSRNGTFCNGNRIDRQPLEDGDKIQVGRTTILKFTYHDRFDESFQKQMYDSALRDPLTRAFNKRYFSDRLLSEFNFSKRHEQPLSLLLLDLDHFKAINDTHGHLAGDQVLVSFANAVQKSVRTEDVFARYGGEEFAIISRSIDREGARRFGERLRHVVEKLEILQGGKLIPVTVSIGAATMPDNIVENPVELISLADRALYWAKERGRNRVESFTDEADATGPA